MFWSIKKILVKYLVLKDRGFQATILSTYDFSTLYTTLLHNFIKEKLLDLIVRTFYKKDGKLYLACNDKKAFFTSADHYRGYNLWSCQNVCDALSFLLDNIYIRLGTKLYRQIVVCHLSWLGPELSSVPRSTGAQLMIFFCLRFPVVLFDDFWMSSRLVTCCICQVLVFASS